MNVQFRRMDYDDLRSVTRLENKLFGADAWSAQSFVNEIENKITSYPFVLTESDKLIGYAVVWYYADEVHIGNLAISPRYQRKGFGKLLMEKIFAKLDHFRTAYLEVRVSNENAIRLYQKMGFVSVTTRTKYYQDGEDAMVMIRENNKGV